MMDSCGNGTKDVEEHGEIIDPPVKDGSASGYLLVQEPSALWLVLDSGARSRLAVDETGVVHGANATRLDQLAGAVQSTVSEISKARL